MRLLAIVLLLAACEGPAGPSGSAGTGALVTTSPEPPGVNCTNGGTKIDVGIDENSDGTLDPSEVTSTSYACNGPGTQSLVATSTEQPGANCPWGGTRIDTGLDVNNDGTLGTGEINDTAYVCAFGPPGAISPSTGVVAAVRTNGVTTSTSDPIKVRFTLKDDRGYPIDLQGAYSANLTIQPRFALAHFTKDTHDHVLPLSVYTQAASSSNPAPQPTMYNPLGSTGAGTLIENGLGAGDYTFTFPSTTTTNGPVAVTYDPAKLDETHVVWIQVSRQTDLVFPTDANTFYSSNVPYYYVPSGSGTPLKREIASQDNCNNCHNKFKAETTATAEFHGGGRVDVGMCNVCHNPGRTVNPLADSASFVHRIHNSEKVATPNLWHGITITYPQDTKNCNTCHSKAAQGAQALENPSETACKGCHDYVSFTNSAPNGTCGVNGALAYGTDGKPLPCNHFAGPQADCASCHASTGGFPTERYHRPVAAPDPNNSWNVGGTNANTNASYVAEGGYVPPGADVITYDVKSVNTVPDTVTPAIKRPQITFKFKRNGTDVVFQTFGPATELMPNFVGSPSAYFAFGMPQDGGLTPADFNAAVSGYIRSIWNGSATGAGGGTLVGPDGTGYYKLTLTGVQIPAAATILTGGIGYTYSLTSTAPLVQTNLTSYPWVPSTGGKAQGGLSVPPPNVWKVASGFTARRQIVDTGKCNACHGSLGVTPTFHAGQRNDGPTCSFCHTPNKTSSGWAADAKYFIHAIHGSRQRTVPYTWHAQSAGVGFDEIEFPGTLNTCTTCHVPNTYDFTNAANMSAIPNMELTTVATGKYNSDPLTNSSYYTLSPYVVADNVTDYGVGYSYNAATNVTVEAAGTTLVLSRLTGACTACHDSTAAIDHMKNNGGLFYATRATALAPTTPPEQCMICHGPGRVAAIGAVHQH